MNEDLLRPQYLYKLNESSYRTVQNELLLESATLLKDSQTKLSKSTASLEEEIRLKINPNNVELWYENQP